MIRHKILIVDDVHAAHHLYKQTLKREEYEILDAERGKEALSLILSEDIELVILDINLPDISGLEVLKKIREKNKELPVIILTGESQKEKVIKAASFDIIHYLVKPINLDMLKRRVKQSLKLDKNEKLGVIATKSKEILDELCDIEIDESLDENVKELKEQIKDIALKLHSLEEKQKEKTKLDEVIWEKEVECPVCGTNFITYNFKSKSLPIKEKESDFHEIYDFLNPLVFDIWVCPECLYASKREDFEDVNMELIEKIAKDKSKRKKIANKADFNLPRNNELGILSYRLAIMSYRYRKQSNAFFGSLYLKACWIAREQRDIDVEMEFMRLVTDYYEKALSSGEKIGGQLSELGLIYLLGELYRRLGDLDKAGKYFMKVKQDPEVKKEKAILRMSDAQMELVKEAKKNKK
ncbi:DUF2225 domain-containing protein [Haliovirga abyssi]|uniref:Response regulatory domain-containing protein n=1 Tax=Haliovirga abyssi TaxID=2996794 RepID=A0AAU9DAC6_9FUSO|nr:DUF2225 domain-containing protein [Haliovirga abyssi]BDU50290.1 hypothetical protein HLVA_08590 [Haliovirga abyssi]